MKKALLLVVSILTTVCISVFAEMEPPYESEIANGKASIIKLTDYQLVGNFKIKDTFEGCPLVNIGGRAFADADTMEGVVIPVGVESIGNTAFNNCKAMKSIIIPDTVTSIGSQVFSGTAYYNNESNWVDNILYVNNHLIKANTKISGDYAVKPGTLTIASSAFERCSNLVSVEFPDSIRNIGNNAFASCKKLTEIKLPLSIQSLGDNVFRGTNITDIYYEGSKADWDKVSIGALNDTITKATIHFSGEDSTSSESMPEIEVIKVKVNNELVVFDQPPVLENGRTLVPLRAIFEALGAEVEWEDSTQTVTAIREETEISLQIGSTKMTVNSDVKTLDVPAKLLNGRTLVPVRAISEALGCIVNWNETTQTVLITQ